MKHVGRRIGFTFGQGIGICGGLLSCFALLEARFDLLIAGASLLGIHNAFWGITVLLLPKRRCPRKEQKRFCSSWPVEFLQLCRLQNYLRRLRICFLPWPSPAVMLPSLFCVCSQHCSFKRPLSTNRFHHALRGTHPRGLLLKSCANSFSLSLRSQLWSAMG